MKTNVLLVLLLLAVSIPSIAQVTVSLGTYTGAGSTNVLLSTSTTNNRYSRTISLYTAGEILAAGGVAGNVTSLAWDKSGTGEYTTNDAYIKVLFKHVTDSVWSTSPVPVWDTEVQGATEVFSSTTFSIPTGTGWKTLFLTTPFAWNGVSNIAVFVEWDRSSTPTAAINWGRSTTTNANATRVGSTSLSALVMLVNSSRPLLQLTISPGGVTPVAFVNVSTQGGVPAVINTNGGTLQMQASIIPSGANQAVSWSMVNGTGTATIDTSGLVTAISNGTVWAKATSVQDSSKMDSLLITISNQIVTVTGVVVVTLGGVPPVIQTPQGTLQMVSTVIPAAAMQNVSWSIVPLTGMASISPTGLVTASSDGTVFARAASVQDPSKSDSLMITISNQSVGWNETDMVRLITISPNPVLHGQLTVTLASGLRYPDTRLQILDVLGRCVYESDVSETQTTINLHHLQPGVYTVLVREQQQQYSQKFVLK